MRRALPIAVLVLAALGLVLWLLVRVESGVLPETALSSSPPPRFGGAGADVPATERLRPAFGTLRCTVEGEGDPGILQASSEKGVFRSEPSQEPTLWMPAGTWTLTWEVRSRSIPLGTLVIADGEVQSCELYSGPHAIEGYVLTPGGRPAPDVEVVSSCGGSARTNARGMFTLDLPGRECTLVATFADGMLQRRSAPVVVGPVSFEEDITLTVDVSPIAGMGVSFQPTEDGAMVTNVQPDSPAALAGLEIGDLITAIDGVSTEGMDANAFIQHGTGRPGTLIDLRVDRDGQTRSIRFRRARINQPNQEDTGTAAP